MRAFIGIPAPPAWVDALDRAQARFRGGRAVAPDDMHVTLAFLDDQPVDRLEDLAEALVATPMSPALLRPAHWAFLGGKAARAMVLDLVAEPSLTEAEARVRSLTRGAGIDLPRRRFRPHITLRRYSARSPAPSDFDSTLLALGPPDLPPAVAEEVILWSSTLTPDGPIYDPLIRVPMGAIA